MNNLINELLKEKIVVIIRGIDSKKLIPLTEALYKGGIRFVEVTFCADGSISDQKNAEIINQLSKHFHGRMHIGAGTVLKESQVELTKSAGGEFIISPNTDVSVIKKTKELDMISIPGALTPSEIQKAHKAGADFVKLFPISELGVDYVKAVKAPLSHIRFLAVGGINADNMPDYLNVGVCGFGIGTNIIDKKMLSIDDYDGIAKLAERYVAVIK